MTKWTKFWDEVRGIAEECAMPGIHARRLLLDVLLRNLEREPAIRARSLLPTERE